MTNLWIMQGMRAAGTGPVLIACDSGHDPVQLIDKEVRIMFATTICISALLAIIATAVALYRRRRTRSVTSTEDRYRRSMAELAYDQDLRGVWATRSVGAIGAGSALADTSYSCGVGLGGAGFGCGGGFGGC